MITLIFFVLLIAFVGAIIVGTLGDELQSFLMGLVDNFMHPNDPEEESRKAYYNAIKRS